MNDMWFDESGVSIYIAILAILCIPIVFLALRAATGDASVGNFIYDFESARFPPVNKDACYTYGVAEMQGKRKYMEDRHVVIDAIISDDPSSSLYGVFDGHGGETASQFCVDALARNFKKEALAAPEPVEALKKAYAATDDQYIEMANKRGLDHGTTALTLLAHGDTLYTANAGDSRAILVKSSGQAVALSSDHKPDRPDEKDRILSKGGQVVFWGVWRVEGILAVSRAIGDRMLKDYVIPTPEVKTWKRSADDHFVVLATDGVWDMFTNDEAARLVISSPDAQTAATALMKHAYARGSMDNICVIVVDLRSQSQRKSEADGDL